MESLILKALYFLSFFYIVSNFNYTLLLFLSWRYVKEISAQNTLTIKDINQQYPFISIIAPAFNEEKIIIESIQSLIDLDYLEYEIVVVNDGSTDKTLDRLIQRFDLYQELPTKSQRLRGFNSIHRSSVISNLVVINQINQGKAQALNNGILLSKGEIICTIDADSIIEKSALKIGVDPFLKTPLLTIATGGTIRILNGSTVKNFKVKKGGFPKNPFAMFQIIEYIRAFFCGRLGFEKLGGTALIPGAFSLFKKEALKEVGGFDPNSLTEDFEIIIRLNAYYAYRNRAATVHMLPYPVCWTLAPEDLQDLYKQRLRWQRGLIQTLWKHKNLIGNFKSKRLGLITLPYMLIFDVFGPLVNFFSIIILIIALTKGILSPSTLALYGGGGIIYGILITLAGIRLEETHYARNNPKKSIGKFILYAVLENFGYRQFVIFSQFVGTISAFSKKAKWGAHTNREMKVNTNDKAA